MAKAVRSLRPPILEECACTVDSGRMVGGKGGQQVSQQRVRQRRSCRGINTYSLNGCVYCHGQRGPRHMVLLHLRHLLFLLRTRPTHTHDLTLNVLYAFSPRLSIWGACVSSCCIFSVNVMRLNISDTRSACPSVWSHQGWEAHGPAASTHGLFSGAMDAPAAAGRRRRRRRRWRRRWR